MLRLLAQGKSGREMADQLVITELTVRTLVGNILGKLHLARRLGAARHALKEGLASLEGAPAEMGQEGVPSIPQTVYSHDTPI